MAPEEIEGDLAEARPGVSRVGIAGERSSPPVYDGSSACLGASGLPLLASPAWAR